MYNVCIYKIKLKMLKLIVFWVVNYNLINSCNSSLVFHEGSKIIFTPDQESDYFGYSVMLNSNGLLVGAPKAKSRVKPAISPGLVFNCSLSNLDIKNVTCIPLKFDDSREIVHFTIKDFFRDDMWFGATIEIVPNGKILVCAPRWANPYKDTHLLSNGACYIQARTRGTSLLPLKETNYQAYKVLDTSRREYGDYGSHLNYYAYGQAGMSIKVTGNNSVIVGAPGLLQWAGGIVDFKYDPRPSSVFFSKQETMNPFYTKELRPDDYLGYSVESGIFESNGKILYVAGAPRAQFGYGQVLIFNPPLREREPLKIKAKVKGPHLGSYFGASLLCSDINGDDIPDLLVGAPNFVKKDAGLLYDQGAVFVYITIEDTNGFKLENATYVSGSDESGARFGTSIADLGDIDGDGFKDVAIGAPWENDGTGVVYIYQGYEKGLRSPYLQRILAEDAKGFGFSISKGFDIDRNNCSDLSIGAFKSSSAYVFRCIPTIQVLASIKVPDVMDLPQNATNFTAMFCVAVPPKPNWMHVKTELKATILIDIEEQRASISGEPQYTVTAKPGNSGCDEQTVEVKPTADLSKPISIKLALEPVPLMADDAPTFMNHAARLSEDSVLESSFDIQLTRDCGEDLTCIPWLELSIEPWINLYIPGTNSKLGATVIVINKAEPAYGAKVNLTLPLPPLRVPSSCALNKLNMTCSLPAPLHRDESVVWDIELDYTLRNHDKNKLVFSALIIDTLHRRNISDGEIKIGKIFVKPEAKFTVSGQPKPNATLLVTRDNLKKHSTISFDHYFEVTNHGPSDWSQLSVQLELSDKVNVSSSFKECNILYEKEVECIWSVPAKVSRPIILPLRFDLNAYGEYLEEINDFNVTTVITLSAGDLEFNSTGPINITTTLILEPAAPIWYLIAAPIAGIVVLIVLVYLLNKCGFFSRQYRVRLRRLKRETLLEDDADDADDANDADDAGCSALPVDLNESSEELICDNS